LKRDLAEPPTLWQFMERDTSIASVMEKEVLSRHRKALMLFGTGNLYHQAGPRSTSAVELYEKNYPGVTLVIADHAGFGSHSPLEKYNDEFESRMAAWPIPSLVEDMAGTWLADLLDKTHTLGGTLVMFRFGKDGKRTETPVDFGGVPPLKMVDAYLYLGPRDLMLKDLHPAEVFLDKDYMAEMKRRAAIMGPGPVTDQADPEKISDRDYSPFFYDPDEMQKMMGFQKMGVGPPEPPK